MWSKWSFLGSGFYFLEMVYTTRYQLRLHILSSCHCGHFPRHDHTHRASSVWHVHVQTPSPYNGTLVLSFLAPPPNSRRTRGSTLVLTYNWQTSPGEWYSGTKPLPGSKSVNIRCSWSCRAEQKD